MLCVTLVTPAVAWQSNNDTHTVRLALEQPWEIRSGVVEKQINRMGDGVSIAIIRTLDEHELADPDNIRKILPMIRMAFAVPEIIAKQDDRVPPVTLLLLDYLESKTQDYALRSEIEDVIQFVKGQTSLKK
jgi:hypothetical protein